jgi:hypothetical protein
MKSFWLLPIKRPHEKEEKTAPGHSGMLILTLLLFTISVDTGYLYAQEHRTPYGEYQDWCGAYGVCKEDMSPREAEMAIERYFSSKGLRVGRIQHRGRFIEAEVYRGNRLTDRIIFDRKTGRMRSVY